MTSRESGQEHKLTLYVGKEHITKSVFITVVPRKGVSETEVAIAFLLDCIYELGYSNTTISIKNDQEPAIKAVIDAVCHQRQAQTILEESPKGSSASNGVVEKGVQDAEHQVRALRLSLEARLNSKIPINHPIIPWLVQHAGFTHNRFQLGHDGKTPYERLKNKSFSQPMLELGESVHYKKTKYEIGPGLFKYDDRWDKGIFLGYRARSNEAFIGTPAGVIRCRTMHRKPPQERWQPQEVQAIRGVPWDMIAPDSPELPAEQQLRPIVDGQQPIVPEALAEGENNKNKRNFKIFKTDLIKHGYTRNCPGCNAAMAGRTPQPAHSSVCRDRYQQILLQDEAGKRRVQSAQERLTNNEPNQQQQQQQQSQQQQIQQQIPADPEQMEEDELFSSENVERTARYHDSSRPAPPEAVTPVGDSVPQTPPDLLDEFAPDDDMLGSTDTRLLAQIAIEYIQYGNHISELFSPPRVTHIATKIGLKPGFALDLTQVDPEDGKPWDLSDAAKQAKAERMVREEKPFLLIGSPPCTAFSTLFSMNHNKMDPKTVHNMIHEALQHLK